MAPEKRRASGPKKSPKKGRPEDGFSGVDSQEDGALPDGVHEPQPRDRELADTIEQPGWIDHTVLGVSDAAGKGEQLDDPLALDAKMKAEEEQRLSAPEDEELLRHRQAGDGQPAEKPQEEDGADVPAPLVEALHERAKARKRLKHQGNRFPIVGVGASAGGLEALQEFFSKMPPDTGMGFVVVTHLHPDHVSLLPELIGKFTTMGVEQVKDGTQVEPNRVYVMRPGRLLRIREGKLHLIGESDGSHITMPIDHFLRSLASDQCENAICVILSGTGTDGTLGLRSIKGESGMAMVQAPSSAKYEGMPASATATGLADYVLSPGDMPQQLIKYANGPYAAGRPVEEAKTLSAETLRDILALLRARTGHDFSGYKMSTIRRRIERRMNVHQIQSPPDYLRYVQDNAHELDMLFTELLISVTSFFRDPEAYQALQRQCVPQLLKDRDENSVLRVWVPGCCTGEEAYSVAMLLHECVDKHRDRLDIQIFGTDLDPRAIETARAGIYSAGVAVDVPPDKLDRYFVHQDNLYRIRKEIREMLVFAPQNLVKDPPFTKLDLITCRNVLIYLDTEMQRRVLAVFHYALRPGGLLFLGPSETIGSFRDLFDIVDAKWKIFRRREGMAVMHPILSMPSERSRLGVPPPPSEVRVSNTTATVQRLLLGKLAPPTIVCDEHGNIVYIHGRTGLYLEPSQGQPRNNVLEMAREGLGQALLTAIRRACTEKVEVVRERVPVRTNGGFTETNINVVRLNEPEALRGLLMVTLTTPEAPRSKRRRKHGEDVGRMEEVERELQYTRESLQTTIEELETSNEELKSTNEELQSTNEELQSTNEELETSKEELQSLNEELATVNTELQSKVDELALANSDMQNLLNNTQIATIFLDTRLNVKRFTESSRELFNLISSDLGRPLGDLTSSLNHDGLLNDCRQVLRTLRMEETQVSTKTGGFYWMRIMPYRTIDNVIDGVVITFLDLGRFRNVIRDREFIESFIEPLRTPVALIDNDLHLYHANAEFCRLFQLDSKQLAKQDDARWLRPRLRELLENLVKQEEPFVDERIENGPKTLLATGRRVRLPMAGPDLVLLALRNEEKHHQAD